MQTWKVLLATAATIALLGLSSAAQAQGPVSPISPSPGWVRALPPGPDTRVKITEEYAKLVARDAYFWAWPMVNIYNRRQAYKDVKDFVMAGPVPTAPLNRVAMLTDYVNPDQRIVACPNQDVVYGAGSIALDVSPVVIQVPDFGDRFWVYQVVDLRRWCRPTRQDVWDYARLLPVGRTQLARRSAQRHHQGVPLSDQHRLCRTTHLPG
jgi:hypothetical protein